VGSAGDTVGQAREQCLREYARCADECERALELLRDDEESRGLRSELIVCAAVCRVAARALEETTDVAAALVEYSVDVCRRCADALAVTGPGARPELAKACTDAAESAATLLLIA
jgi:hypothetical protein